jgi:hypothetical protein
MPIKYRLRNIKNYPDNGDHQEVVFDDYLSFPFYISKGLDSFRYEFNGRICKYNSGKNTTKNWIVKLQPWANDSLNNIFDIKIEKDVDKLIAHCVKLYKRSILLEIERFKKELQLIEREK